MYVAALHQQHQTGIALHGITVEEASPWTVLRCAEVRCGAVRCGAFWWFRYLCGDFGLLSYDPAAAAAAGEGGGGANAGWARIDGCPQTSCPLMSAHSGEVYIMSGYNPDHSTPLMATWSYSPKSQSWRRHADLPTNNAWGAAVSVSARLVAHTRCTLVPSVCRSVRRCAG